MGDHRNGNAPIVTKTVDGKETVIPPTSVEEKAQRKAELKARSTLLMALPNENQLKAPRNQDSGKREPIRRTMLVEETTSNVLVSHCDGLGYDWSDQVEEECVKYLKDPNEHLVKVLRTARISVVSYKTGLESVEARLDSDITKHKRKLELATKEKDEVQLTIQKFENSSKSLSKLLDRQIMDKCKTRLGYNAIPPSYRNFMPPKPNLVDPSLDDFVDVNEYVLEKPTVEFNERKTVKKENGALVIEDWVSERNPQQDFKDKGVIDSVFSRHMIGNRSYLTDYEEINRRFVAFGDFKLTNKSHVLLKVPRKNNMYSVDLKNVVPQGDHLGKFDGKADEGFFVGYSTNSKAFRVFNSRTRIVKENMHVKFSENTPNIASSGPNWIFDINALTKSMNYKPIVVENQSIGSAATKACNTVGKTKLVTVPYKDYVLLPLWTQDPLSSFSLKDSFGAGFKPSMEEQKKDAEEPWNQDSGIRYSQKDKIKSKTNKTENEMAKRENSKSTMSKSPKVKVKDRAETKEILNGPTRTRLMGLSHPLNLFTPKPQTNPTPSKMSMPCWKSPTFLLVDGTRTIIND
nr:ribonuclease H-like domain-containing protein [Tanacetum cinerariifolium]